MGVRLHDGQPGVRIYLTEGNRFPVRLEGECRLPPHGHFSRCMESRHRSNSNRCMGFSHRSHSSRCMDSSHRSHCSRCKT